MGNQGPRLTLLLALALPALAMGQPRVFAPPPIAVDPESEASPPAAPSPTDKAASPTFEDQVVEIVNQERLANGVVPPLKRASQLDSSAETHSSNMATRDFFGHCDLDTLTQPGDRVTAAGYSWSVVAENIAAGYATPVAVMAGWMASSGHRANILRTTVREIGVGYVQQVGDLANIRADLDTNCVGELLNQGPYVHYWTQNFGTRLSSATTNFYPLVINREAFATTTREVALYVYGPGNAIQMRFSHDGATWTAFEPFSTSRAWTLPFGNGTRSVFSQVQNGTTTYNGQDTIELDLAGDPLFADGFESGDLHAGIEPIAPPPAWLSGP